MARKLPFRDRTLRRARVYSGRLLRSSALGGPACRSLFYHMPKCGGTSLSEAMAATVPLHQRVGVVDALSTRRAAAIEAFGRDDARLCHEDLEHGAAVFEYRERLLLQHMAWDSWLIHGHMLFSEAADRHFGDSYGYVTLLREPVGRMLSNYRMARRAGIVPDDFDAYLDSPVAERHAQVFLRYLSGEWLVRNIWSATQLAQQRLERFAVVGVLEDLPRFAADYRRVFGTRLAIPSYNRAKGPPLDLTSAQMDRVRALCAADQRIYDHVLGRKTETAAPAPAPVLEAAE